MDKKDKTYSVADVLKATPFHNKPAYIRKTFESILKCRTEEMDGHACKCKDCDHIEKGYNSCGNRACPTCSGRKQKEWVIKTAEDVLPCKYFHLVFTIPHEFNSFYIYNKKIFTNLMFDVSKKVLLNIIKAKWNINGGATAVIHTWGATLSIHPHVHLIVPAAGFDCKTGQWKGFRKYFLSHKKVMQLHFRNIFMTKIKKLIRSEVMKCPSSLGFIMTSEASWLDFFNKPHSKDWQPYVKKNFGSEVQVIKYLGSYTHRIAISNYRILKVEDGRVTFLFKNYLKKNYKDVMNLSCEEFARRFAHHIPEKRTVRIRHFGCMGNRYRKENIAKARAATKHFWKRDAKLKKTIYKMRAKLESAKLHNENRMSVCPKCSGEMLKIATKKSYKYLDSG